MMVPVAPPGNAADLGQARPPAAPRRLRVVTPAEKPGAPAWTAEAVFHEHGGLVYHLARRMLGNEADAEDVTQEVLLQVVRKLDGFRGESELTTWLHRVTVNAALMLRRSRARRPAAQAGCLEDLGGRPARATPPPGPDRQALDREARALLERAVASLPEDYRDAYLLADVEGLPNQEAADLLGIGLAALKSRLHRARLMLRDALAPYFRGEAG